MASVIVAKTCSLYEKRKILPFSLVDSQNSRNFAAI